MGNPSAKGTRDLADYLPEIRTVVRQIARDEGVVDDLVQECCLRIIQKEGLWDERKGTFAAWMGTVSRRVVYRFLSARRRGGERERRCREELQKRAFSGRDGQGSLPEVMERFHRLTPAQKEVLILRYLRGITVVEIAQKLGIRHQSVSERLSGALLRLRRRGRTPGLFAAFVSWKGSVLLQEAALMTATHKVFATATACLFLGAAGSVLVVSSGFQTKERAWEEERERLRTEKTRLEKELSRRPDEAVLARSADIGTAGEGSTAQALPLLPASELRVETGSRAPATGSGGEVVPDPVPTPAREIPGVDFYLAWQLPDPHMSRDEVVAFYDELSKRDDPNVDLYLQHCLSLIEDPPYVTTIDGFMVRRFAKSDVRTQSDYVAAIQKNLVRALDDADLLGEFVDLARRLPKARALECLTPVSSYPMPVEQWEKVQAAINELSE